jgi:hypothetical protein
MSARFVRPDVSVPPGYEARLGDLIAELPRSAIQGPLARAVIIRRLRGLRSWHILGVHCHQQGFSVHLVRVPDAQSGPTPFIMGEPLGAETHVLQAWEERQWL